MGVPRALTGPPVGLRRSLMPGTRPAWQASATHDLNTARVSPARFFPSRQPQLQAGAGRDSLPDVTARNREGFPLTTAKGNPGLLRHESGWWTAVSWIFTAKQREKDIQRGRKPP
jgi:hypothetical protein